MTVLLLWGVDWWWWEVEVEVEVEGRRRAWLERACRSSCGWYRREVLSLKASWRGGDGPEEREGCRRRGSQSMERSVLRELVESSEGRPPCELASLGICLWWWCMSSSWLLRESAVLSLRCCLRFL